MRLFELLISLMLILCLKEVQGAEADSNEHFQMRRLVATFQAYETPACEQVWPHFELSHLPTVVHFKSGHLYAFHIRGDRSLWRPDPAFSYPVLFCLKHPSGLARIMLHPAMPIEGQRAFVFRLEAEKGEAADLSLLTFVHERFHLHQFRYFAKPKNLPQDYADHRSEENLTEMEVEHALLTHFLQDKDPRKKVEYLKDYLAVSLMRQKKIEPSS